MNQSEKQQIADSFLFLANELLALSSNCWSVVGTDYAAKTSVGLEKEYRKLCKKLNCKIQEKE
jgi:hypothetical protein